MDITQKNGPTSSEVTIQFSGGRTATFHLAATVIQELLARINMGRIKRGDRIKKRYVESSANPISPNCKYQPDNGILLERNQIDGYAIIDITLTPEFRASGNFSVQLPFTCSKDSIPNLHIEGHAEDLVVAETPLVSLGYITQSSQAKAYPVKFYSPYGKSFKWLETETPKAEHVLLTQSDPTLPVIEFSLVPPFSEGLITETVQLHFSVDDDEPVILPATVHAYVTSESLGL